jgi:hypothetical protein
LRPRPSILDSGCTRVVWGPRSARIPTPYALAVAPSARDPGASTGLTRAAGCLDDSCTSRTVGSPIEVPIPRRPFDANAGRTLRRTSLHI